MPRVWAGASPRVFFSMPNVVVAEGNELPFSLITWGMGLDTPTLCEVFEGKREEETEALAEEDGKNSAVNFVGWGLGLGTHALTDDEEEEEEEEEDEKEKEDAFCFMMEQSNRAANIFHLKKPLNSPLLSTCEASAAHCCCRSCSHHRQRSCRCKEVSVLVPLRWPLKSQFEFSNTQTVLLPRSHEGVAKSFILPLREFHFSRV